MVGPAESRQRWRRLALLLVTASILLAGLAPFELRPRNDARLERSGLYFGGFERSEGSDRTRPRGLALLAEPLRIEAGAAPGGFTIALWLRPDFDPNAPTRYPLVLDDGFDPPLLELGQKQSSVRLSWREHSDDGQAHSRPLGRWAAFAPDQSHFVAVISGEDGTRIHVDGESEPSVTSSAAVLSPGEGFDAQVWLGSDAEGRHPWVGALEGLAVFSRALERSELVAVAAGLRSGVPEAAARSADVWLDLRNSAAPPAGLILPERFTPPRQRVLGTTRLPDAPDALLNLFGFAPLGVLAAMRPGRRSTVRTIAEAGCLAAVLSLSIELTQVAMPSRDSSLYDWLLNTAGGLLGAALAFAPPRWRATD